MWRTLTEVFESLRNTSQTFNSLLFPTEKGPLDILPTRYYDSFFDVFTFTLSNSTMVRNLSQKMVILI